MSDASNPTSADGWPPEDFKHHDDYSTLMLGARRNAAPHIGAPAITRHLGFWVPDELTLKSEASITLKRDEWVKNIEHFFVALHLRLKKVSRISTSSRQKRGHDSKPRLYLIHHSYPIKEGDRGPECIKGAKELPIRHQRFVLSFVWQSMPVVLTLEMFEEYFTLSTAIDLSNYPASNTRLLKAITSFNDLASKRCDAIGKGEAAAASAPQERVFTDAFEDIYYTAWKDLYGVIFPDPLAAHAATLGKVFAEFRGFVACRDGAQFIGADAKAERSLEDEIGNKRFGGQNAIRCVDAIRPFLAADAWVYRKHNADGGAECSEPREFTFTPVLNGRYIYASALGTPPSPLRARDMPLTYMLLAANHCPSELGLLVDGLHVLGTTRLAALYDFPHLIHAALELRDLEGKISKLLSLMMEGKTDEALLAADERLARELPGFSERLAKIEQGIRPEDNDNKPQIAGGFSFRVERSQYYQRQFRGMVRALRIGRIQGFLTYDEAVARRLGGIYDLINTVGLRHERLREILTALSSRVQTARITKETATIEELQKAAEVGFWAFLFPYYFGNVMVHILHVTHIFENYPSTEPIIFIVSFVAGVCKAVYGSSKKSTDEETRKSAPATKRIAVRTLPLGIAAISVHIDLRSAD